MDQGTTTAPPAAPRLRAVWADPDAYATTLLVAALDAYGPDVLEWHPATIRDEIRDDYGLVVTDATLDRLMAAIAVLTTDLFWTSAGAFVQIANVLSGSTFAPDVFDPADSVECAWAVTEALLLDPADEDNPEPFGDEVRYYIGAVLKEEGYVQTPDVLAVALGAGDAGAVADTFADDPAMFGAVYDLQADKAGEVEAVVRAGLQDLIHQLQALPLTNGSTADLVGRLRGRAAAAGRRAQGHEREGTTA